MAKMTKAQARKRLKECQAKLKHVALEEQFPISIFKNSMKMIEQINKMIKVLE